jgi:hypothetical protein
MKERMEGYGAQLSLLVLSLPKFDSTYLDKIYTNDLHVRMKEWDEDQDLLMRSPGPYIQT